MSTNNPTLISETNLSVAWAKAFLTAMRRAKDDLAPLTLSIGGFSGAPAEDAGIRQRLDTTLLRYKDKNIFSSAVSALTIFPWKLWKMNGYPDCATLTRQYLAGILPRFIARDSNHNKYGTYFGRMVNFGVGPRDGAAGFNQLDFIINEWRRCRRRGRHPRHSAMVVSCFDPARDHTHQPVRGFPCLQQVSFGRDDHGGLSVSAYYPTQYLFDRAYGNYLGLSHLGQFMASQLRCRLVRINVFIGRPELGSVAKKELKPMAEAIGALLLELENA